MEVNGAGRAPARPVTFTGIGTTALLGSVYSSSFSAIAGSAKQNTAYQEEPKRLPKSNSIPSVDSWNRGIPEILKYPHRDKKDRD